MVIILWTFTYPTYRITLNKISPVEADVRFHACLSEFMLPLCGQPMKPLIYRAIDQTPNGTDCLGQEWKQECSTATCAGKNENVRTFMKVNKKTVLQRPWEEQRPDHWAEPLLPLWIETSSVVLAVFVSSCLEQQRLEAVLWSVSSRTVAASLCLFLKYVLWSFSIFRSSSSVLFKCYITKWWEYNYWNLKWFDRKNKSE